MLGHKFAAVVTLMGATHIAGQSLPVSLSSSCSTSLQGLLTAPEASCLNLASLLSFVASPDKSVPETVNTWLTGLCAQGSCSDQNISDIVANVTRGCSEDFSNANIDILSLQDQITSIAQRVYPTVRKIACLEDTTTNQLCVTQTLNNLEGVIGKLGLDDLNLDNLNQDVQTVLASNITQLLCTDCIKAGFAIARDDFHDQVSLIDDPVRNVCGASFLDGNTSGDINATAASGEFSPVVAANNGAKRETFTGAAGLRLLIVSSAFIFLT